MNNYNLTFECRSGIDYCESCTYKWIRDNNIVYSGHRYITTKSLLVIINLTVADTGQYQCTMFNNMEKKIATKTIQLVIKGTFDLIQPYYVCMYVHTYAVPAPRIITHPVNVYAAAPFSGVFTCSASGYGIVSVNWMRKDLTILETMALPAKAIISLEYSPEVTTSTLLIPNVTISDVGRYYCIVWAENKASRSNIAKLLLSGM